MFKSTFQIGDVVICVDNSKRRHSLKRDYLYIVTEYNNFTESPEVYVTPDHAGGSCKQERFIHAPRLARVVFKLMRSGGAI